MTESPIEQLLAAFDSLDPEVVMALLAPEVRLLTADGQRAAGTGAARELISDFVSPLRSTTHRLTAQWQQDDVWIAEFDATYELKDGMQTGTIPRAVVVRVGPDGIIDLRAYGAQERPLTDHDTGEQWGRLVRGHWIPPL